MSFGTSLTVIMMLQSGAFPTIAGEAYLLVVFVWSLTIPPHYSLDADRFHYVIKAILELGIDMLTVVCLGLLIVLFFAAAIRVVKKFWRLFVPRAGGPVPAIRLHCCAIVGNHL